MYSFKQMFLSSICIWWEQMATYKVKRGVESEQENELAHKIISD